MPISRELQVSDLGFCDRETANLGLAQHSPRHGIQWSPPDCSVLVTSWFLSHSVPTA